MTAAQVQEVINNANNTTMYRTSARNRAVALVSNIQTTLEAIQTQQKNLDAFRKELAELPYADVTGENILGTTEAAGS